LIARPVQFSYAQQLARKGVREQDKRFMGFITSSHDWPTSATGNREIANPNAHCFAMYNNIIVHASFLDKNGSCIML
jgi:hypothetical protein